MAWRSKRRKHHSQIMLYRIIEARSKAQLPFYRISEAVSLVVERSAYAARVHGLDGILECDRAARLEAKSVIGCMSLT